MNQNNIRIINEVHGVLLDETFINPAQFKLFLKMVQGCIAMKEDLTFFNGVDFLIHIPTNILKECLVVGNTKEVSPGEIVMAKSKMES